MATYTSNHSKFSASQVAGSTQSATFNIEEKFVQTLCGVRTDGVSMFSDKHPLRYVHEMRDTCKQIIEKNSKVLLFIGSVRRTLE